MTNGHANRKVLVVDDLLTVRKVMRKLLVSIGFSPENIFEAGQCNQAKEQLLGNRFDLLICDWNMPEMSGIELVEWARQQEPLKRLPIVMATANRGREHVVEAAEKGVSAYLSKPFSADVLKEKVDEALRGTVIPGLD